MLAEKDIARRLREGQINLPPLCIRPVERARRSQSADWIDAVVAVTWGKRREMFAVEFKARSTPKAIRAAMLQIKSAAQAAGLNPMLIVPYLSEEMLLNLEREGISGVDLCGNGIVMAPDGLAAYRTGYPNKFTSSAPIKNIYRGSTSMVGRLFLAETRFARITDVEKGTNRRNVLCGWSKQPITLGTVSKALATLEEDLIIGRTGSSVKLLQADKLLQKLVDNYVPPKVQDVIQWQVPMPESRAMLMNDVLKDAFKSEIPAVLTGKSPSTISLYAVMQAGGMNTIYCPDPESWLAGLPGSRTDRFPTFSVVQTEDPQVYFDARREKDMTFASPVQTYLELMTGDKRDQETAQQLRDSILRSLAEFPV